MLVNPRSTPARTTVPPGYRFLDGRQDPRTNSGEPASLVTLAGKDGRILRRDTAGSPERR